MTNSTNSGAIGVEINVLPTNKKHSFLEIRDSGDKHVFSVEIGNTIKWTDKKGVLHTVKTEKDLDTAMAFFVEFVNTIRLAKDQSV